MNPYYEQDGITIYHGDCREVLPTLEPVDLVLTDPPYGIGFSAWDDHVPYELIADFSQSTVVWFGAASRFAIDPKLFPAAPQRSLIWAPSFTLSHTRSDGIAYRWHPIYLWRIPDKHDGPSWDLLTDPTECGNPWFHPCTKPLTLIKKLVGFCPHGGVILDPYMGSGTTLRAAKDLSRKAIGIEIEERYCEIAAKRLQQSVLPLHTMAAV
jgi:site-specific DNA-methyltransferase (adenine-specific)